MHSWSILFLSLLTLTPAYAEEHAAPSSAPRRAVLLPAFCTDESLPTEDPGPGEIIDVKAHPEVLETLFLEDMSKGPELELVKDRLRAAVESSPDSVYFKFTEAAGPIKGAGMKTLSKVFSSGSCCARECSACQALSGDFCGLAPAGNGTGINSSTGICGELSVVHALTNSDHVSTPMVRPDWSSIVNGNNWHNWFVSEVWRQAGSRTTGTTTGQQQSALGAGWNEGYYFDCGSTTTPSSAGSVRAWCEAINTEIQDGHGCLLELKDGGPDRDKSHRMYALNASYSGGSCDFTTVNTGIQGSPTGTNVPRNPGNQTWRISGDAASPTIRNSAGSSQDFWNGRSYRNTTIYCCTQRQYRYVFSPYPDAPGSLLQ